jgi:transposase
MNKASTIGLDLAKQVFQVHGADATGAVVFRKRLRRTAVLQFFASQAPCRVAMEACASSHYWGRELSRIGHEVRLIPPAYVKPFVKRQKNDAADAEAICEASQRPTMPFVQIKSETAQAAAVVFRVRDLLVRQRTQIINALRGHLAEFGLVVPTGPAHVGRLLAEAEDYVRSLPQAVRPILGVLIEALHSLDEKIAILDVEISRRAEEDEDARRLKTIPGIGPVTAAAISALAPPAQTFARGRDFAAWLGLTPLQRSTGGKQKLGGTSKRGERTIRRRRPPSQGWKTFLHDHADGIASMDLFVVPTISFRLLYGLLILQHARRELLWLAVTTPPTTEWIARQFTEAFGWRDAPRYVVRDRDRVYGANSSGAFAPWAFAIDRSRPVRLGRMDMRRG